LRTEDLNLIQSDVYLLSGAYQFESREFTVQELRARYKAAHPQTASEQPAPEAQEGAEATTAVTLIWESLPYLRVMLLTGQEPGRLAENDLREHREIIESVTGKPATIPGGLHDLKKVRFLTAELSSAQRMRIAVRVETSDPRILSRERCRLHAREGLGFEIDLNVYAPGRADVEAAFEVTALITPAEKPPRFKGTVALDFGNTGTVVVCMSEEGGWIKHLDQGEPFEVLPLARDIARGGSQIGDFTVMPSVLGIDRCEPADGLHYQRAVYEIGHAARDRTDVIYAPKRLVVDPRKGEACDRSITGLHVSIEKRIPTELYIARLLELFIRRKKAVPVAVRITYPTTFTLREAFDVRLAVYDAMRRAIGVTERLRADDAESRKVQGARVEVAVPAPLDEATAAASYLLFRDFVIGAGGIRAFIDLYPRGLYAMVFDCGGGTTDIALVRARGQVERDPQTAREVFTFRINALSRTGHRRFGGDEMTLCLFSLLKEQLGQIIGGIVEQGDPANDPSAPHDAQRAARGVPTEWMQPGPSPGTRVPREDVDDVAARRSLVNTLWNFAEDCKRRLSTKGATEVALEAITGGATNLLAELFSVRPDLVGLKDELIAAISAAKVTRQELDQRVEPLLNETIERMNHLIEHKLDPGQRLARVYVIGNGSRYPLIRERVAQRLHVPYPERIIVHEDGETKLAVAKGACINAWLGKRNELVVWEADRDLIFKLPFDVVTSGLGPGIPEEIYRPAASRGQAGRGSHGCARVATQGAPQVDAAIPALAR
jgi:hypothetical protein